MSDFKYFVYSSCIDWTLKSKVITVLIITWEFLMIYPELLSFQLRHKTNTGLEYISPIRIIKNLKVDIDNTKQFENNIIILPVILITLNLIFYGIAYRLRKTQPTNVFVKFFKLLLTRMASDIEFIPL